MDIAKILIEIERRLTKNRYEHTVRVMNTAESLAELHNGDKEKVLLASALHDYAKCDEKSSLKKIIIDKNLEQDVLNYHHELWHAHVGAYLAENEFRIKDIDVLNAIKYHTTGRPNMGLTELIVFVADYIEPARTMPGVDDVRKIAQTSLQLAALKILQSSIPYLISIDQLVYPETVYTYNDLLKKETVNL